MSHLTLSYIMAMTIVVLILVVGVLILVVGVLIQNCWDARKAHRK